MPGLSEALRWYRGSSRDTGGPPQCLVQALSHPLAPTPGSRGRSQSSRSPACLEASIAHSVLPDPDSPILGVALPNLKVSAKFGVQVEQPHAHLVLIEVQGFLRILATWPQNEPHPNKLFR